MRASYDSLVDVLYVNIGPPVEIEGDGLPGGVELDYSLADGKPCGVTVIGFYRNHWREKFDELASITSKHLSADVKETADAITKALRSASV